GIACEPVSAITSTVILSGVTPISDASIVPLQSGFAAPLVAVPPPSVPPVVAADVVAAPPAAAAVVAVPLESSLLPDPQAAATTTRLARHASTRLLTSHHPLSVDIPLRPTE